jgi:hypothetical protein
MAEGSSSSESGSSMKNFPKTFIPMDELKDDR